MFVQNLQKAEISNKWKLILLTEKICLDCHLKSASPTLPPSVIFQKIKLSWWNWLSQFYCKLSLDGETEKLIFYCISREFLRIPFIWRALVIAHVFPENFPMNLIIGLGFIFPSDFNFTNSCGGKFDIVAVFWAIKLFSWIIKSANLRLHVQRRRQPASHKSSRSERGTSQVLGFQCRMISLVRNLSRLRDHNWVYALS